MLQIHRAVSKYDKAETRSAVSLHYIKGKVLLRETTEL
jgi:hypothetical protein